MSDVTSLGQDDGVPESLARALMRALAQKLSASREISRARWRLFEGPYEVAGVIRVVLVRDGWLVGLDAFDTVDGDARLRVWSHPSGDAEVTELDELPASIESLGAVIGAIASLDGPTDPSVELLGPTSDVVDNPSAAVSRVVDALLVLTARATETSPLLLRSGAPRRFEESLGYLLRDLSTLANGTTEDATPAQLADDAVRYMLASELSPAASPLSASSGHQALRRLADPMIVRVLNNPVLVDQRESADLQVLLERVAQDDIAEGLRLLRTLGRWVAEHLDAVDHVLMPALADESWLVSEEERRSYLALAEGLLTLRQEPFLATQSSEPLSRVITRAIYWFGTKQALRSNVVRSADDAIRRFRADIERLTVARKLYEASELRRLDDYEYRVMSAATQARFLEREIARRRTSDVAGPDQSALVEQLRTLAGATADRVFSVLVADPSAAAYVRAALVGDALARYTLRSRTVLAE